MHSHTPSKYRYAFARFLSFLLSPVETYRCYRYGFDICSVCQAEVTLPDIYFGPVVKGIYILGGVAIGLIGASLPFLNGLITSLLVIAFHHVVSSFAFGFFPWEENEMRSTDTICADAKKNYTEK